jgi:hypothetical protein
MAWQAISAAGRPGAGRRCADVHASDGPAEDQSRRSGQATHPPGPRPRRQSLFVQGDPDPPARPRHHRCHPATIRPDRPPEAARVYGRQASGLRQRGLQRPQRRRTELQHLQTVEGPGNPLRQTRTHLSRRSCSPGNQHLTVSFRRHALGGFPALSGH